MGVFSWARRKVITGALKDFGMSETDAKELVSRLSSSTRATQGNQANAPPGNQTPDQGPSMEFLPRGEEPEGDTSTGDAVLDRYYGLLHQAKDPKAIAQWGSLIQDRETFLRRSAQNSQNRRRSMKAEEGESNEQTSTPIGANLDLTNLAPHADEIAGELMGQLKKLGFGDLKVGNLDVGEIIKNGIAGEIKKRPTVVKEALDGLASVLARYGTAGQGSQGQGGPAAPVFDPTTPEKWAPTMGYT